MNTATQPRTQHSTGTHTDTRLALVSAWTVLLSLARNSDVSDYSKTVSFRFHQTVSACNVGGATFFALEPGFSYSRATDTTTAIAEQESELLLFILYDDISCRSEVTWVAFEVSELNEQRPSATWKCANLTCMYTLLLHSAGAWQVS